METKEEVKKPKVVFTGTNPLLTPDVKKEEKKNDKPKMSEEDAMERLAAVMNDTPTIVKLGEHGFPITALKPGTQYLIAEEACKICKAEKGNMMDVIKQFAVNIPSVIKVLTLAILNDKDRIYADYATRKFSGEYDSVYQTIEWETNPKHWISLLVEVVGMLSMDYFFQCTSQIEMLKAMTLERKRTMKELKSLSPEQNGGK